MRRIYLFLAAFGAAMFALLAVDYGKSRYVLEPLERQTNNIYAISRFLNCVENGLNDLENYRWDYGDADRLTKSLKQQRRDAARYLDMIEKDLDTVGEEQYLLACAVDTTYATLAADLDRIESDLSTGRRAAAAERYYDRAQPCGDYLRQYARQLLEVAIHENQTAYLHTIALKQKLQSLQALVVVACVLLGAVLLTLVRQLLGPVEEMSRASREIGRGNFDIPDVSVPRQDELGRMADAFNEMKHSMKNRVQLLNEKNEMERALHRRETEALEMKSLIEREKMQQLRSQINPHFLFNTLNVIQYTAGQENAPRTQALLTSLSSLFRYSLVSNEERVPLSHEVHIVDNLFLLYHVRFGERIRMEWRITPRIDLTETLVPSLLLQPLVENAFRHGLSPKEEGGLVRICINNRNRRLYISVSDNGVGMSPERLAVLRSNMRNEPVNGEHIGMYNVAARLALLGADCCMEIHSREGRGTCVVLRLPLMTLEEKEEESD
ncbi:MAG: histidine kinase, partial [Gemmiger sp.]